MTLFYHLCQGRVFLRFHSVLLYSFSTGEQHISEPKYRHSNQHCASAGDDSQGKSGKKSPEISETHKIISFITGIICYE